MSLSGKIIAGAVGLIAIGVVVSLASGPGPAGSPARAAPELSATQRLSYCAAGLSQAGRADRRLKAASYKIGTDPTVISQSPTEVFSCPATSPRGEVVIAVAAVCRDVLDPGCVDVRSAYLNGRPIELR